MRKSSITVLFVSTLSCLLVFSLIFSLERIVSADTADYMVKLINERTLYTGSYRFIAYFTQVIPLVFIYFEAPFQTIVQAYSFNLMLFHVAIIAFIYFFLKDTKGAAMALIALLITSTFLFYYPVTELQMGLTLSVLLYSFSKRFIIGKEAHVLSILIALFLAVTVLYAHPLAISFVGFMLAYTFLQKKISFKESLLFSLITVLIFSSKYFLFTVVNDSNNVEFLNELVLFPKEVYLKFWRLSVSKLYLFLAAFIFAVSALAVKRKWLHLLFFITFFYLNYYFSLSKWTEAVHWYNIHLCLPFFYLVAFVFVEELFKKGHSKLQFLLLLPIFIISLFQIPDNKKYNQQRMAIIDDYVKEAMDLHTQKAYILHKVEENNARNWLWALEYESLVLSLYKYDKPVTVIYKNDDQMDAFQQQENMFLTIWGVISYEELNQAYFSFKMQPYLKLTKASDK